MDGPVTPDSDASVAAAIADLDARALQAKVHDDAIGPFLAATAAGLRAQRAIRDDIRRAGPNLTTAEIDKLNKAAGENASYNATQEMHHAVRALVRRVGWRLLALCCGIAGGLLIVGLLGGMSIERWLLTHPDIADMACADQSGGRFCGLWVVPPQPAQPPKR